MNSIVQFFDLGGSLKLDAAETSANAVRMLQSVQGLMDKTAALGVGPGDEDATRAAAAEFVLEGLYAHRRISRNEELGFTADERSSGRRSESASEEEPPRRGKQRRQYN
jgi:magnesium chelatase subunit I